MYDQRFGITCLSHLYTLTMGQTSDPETLVIHQKMTPGNNPEDFMQHVTIYNPVMFYKHVCHKLPSSVYF
jgi:hypothetical protein